jgi:hypothetical protein
LNFVSCDCQPDQESLEQDLDWACSVFTPKVDDDVNVPFDRPGDVWSIRRDGKPHDKDSPDLIWDFQPGDKITGVPDTNEPFEWPDGVSSVPRDHQPVDCLLGLETSAQYSGSH